MTLLDPWAEYTPESHQADLSVAADTTRVNWEMEAIMYAYGRAIGPFWDFASLRRASNDSGFRKRILEDALAALLAEGFTWEDGVLCKR